MPQEEEEEASYTAGSVPNTPLPSVVTQGVEECEEDWLPRPGRRSWRVSQEQAQGVRSRGTCGLDGQHHGLAWG